MSNYTISDLESLAGVNRRNIHFYVQQGIVPPPDGAGLAARYDEEHVLRLRAIPVLRNRGLRLDEIRERLSGLTKREVESLIAQPQPRPGETTRRRSRIAGTTTIRYELAPGVELFVDSAHPQAIREKIADLIERAEQLFGEERNRR